MLEGVAVSPTEPTVVRTLGVTSGEPERFGVAVLWRAGAEGAAAVGVQRKELRDLVRSLRDGRLAHEVAAMASLTTAVLLVEGRPRWSPPPDERLVTGGQPGITRSQLRALLWSVQRRGIWVTTSRDLADTVGVIRHLHAWFAKRTHVALDVRRATATPADDPDAFAVHLLQSFPSVGPVLARSVIDHFGGVPLAWTCDADELASVPGLGPVRAARLLSGLGRR